jgi:Gpi18-like mannosyltransferase/predicted membrane-bound dolichyl-phosphate-mannose-protein mannosyltransferase
LRSEAAASSRTGAVRPPSAEQARESSGGFSTTTFALALLLLLGLVVRLLFINADGFKNDVSTFESWSLTLAEHPLREFFAKAGFADYPPGYFFVLWFVGHAYKTLVHSDPTYGLLRIAVKLPGILMDLVDAALIYAIVRRFSSVAWAFAAAAAFAFNPATIFISAYWGQVDSVAAGLTLGSLLLLIDADKRTNRLQMLSIVGAWLLLAYSILIKPPAIVVAPLYLAYVFATDDSALRARRAIATGIGIIASFALAYVCALAFNPTYNPVAQFAWLIGRYAYASGVYPYNSVNAFNLYVMAVNHFWQADSNLIPNWTIAGHTIGFPLYVWGVGLFGSAVILVVSRYAQRRDPIAILEAAMILSLGYFVLSTRMHERYIFNAVLLATPLIFFRKRYLYATVVLSLTLLANLFYSFDYLGVLSNNVAGVDPTDLMPFLSRPAAILNVATFFYLGYVFLGAGSDALQGVDLGRVLARVSSPARRWFSPLEGTAWMTSRDWILASSLAVSSFVLTFVDYTWPSEKIFDEIYYARAGEEYLTHKEIFEFTHPPLTKLWITLSMILFGGMHGAGDTAAGWRFLNLVMGALMVFVIYCFAKRLLGSTLFATIAAGMLLFDGFHYVQSRIATPEITVAFFSLLTLYAFYRFWIASQVRVASAFAGKALPQYAFAALLAAAVALTFSSLVAVGQSAAAHIVAFLYAGSGTYIAMRALVPRLLRALPLVSYAEGSRVRGGVLETLDGGRIPTQGRIDAGESTRAEQNGLVYVDAGLHVTYARGGAVEYATDDGSASFAPDGTMRAGAATTDGNRDGRLWLWLLAIAAGCLAASKWNGLFDFFVIWGLTFAVVVQRYWGSLQRAIGRTGILSGPASWGNPFGFSFDLVVATMLFVGGTIYVLCYIPYLLLGHNLGDLVSLQQQMFGYHYDLKATHPYGSKWWQWPFILRPISYYYHDWRTGAATQDSAACCVAEIIAIPNPAVWWLGLVSIPFAGWLAFRERNKGYLLLFVAYFLQWLPWATSPRVAFEYHFFPNLAVICLANAVLLQRVWRYGEARFGSLARAGRAAWPQLVVGGYLVLVVGLFVFFFPILAGLHVRWNVWDARMWHWLMHNQWV